MTLIYVETCLLRIKILHLLSYPAHFAEFDLCVLFRYVGTVSAQKRSHITVLALAWKLLIYMLGGRA